MTIPFNPPKPSIALMALSVLGATASATAEPTSEATVTGTPSNSTVAGDTPVAAPESAALVVCSPKRSLSELTRQLLSQPNDEAALSAVCMAMSDGGQIEDLVAQLTWCSSSEGDSLPDHAMAELAFRIAKGCTGAHARELCRAALDLCAVHVGALAMFEELADASWADELCARYQVFLEDAPMHGISPDLCEAVSNKLAEAERNASVKEDLDPMYGLCETLKKAFALVVSGVDSVTDRQFLDVLSLQA